MALCQGLPRWAGTRKVKPIWILLKQETVSGSDISWAICKSAPRSRQKPCQHLTTQFFTDRMPFLPPNQQRQSTEGIHYSPTAAEKLHNENRSIISNCYSHVARRRYRQIHHQTIWISSHSVHREYLYVHCRSTEYRRIWLWLLVSRESDRPADPFSLSPPWISAHAIQLRQFHAQYLHFLANSKINVSYKNVYLKYSCKLSINFSLTLKWRQPSHNKDTILRMQISTKIRWWRWLHDILVYSWFFMMSAKLS